MRSDPGLREWTACVVCFGLKDDYCIFRLDNVQTNPSTMPG